MASLATWRDDDEVDLTEALDQLARKEALRMESELPETPSVYETARDSALGSFLPQLAAVPAIARKIEDATGIYMGAPDDAAGQLVREGARRAQNARYGLRSGGEGSGERLARGLAYYGGQQVPLATEVIATRGKGGKLAQIARGGLMGAAGGGLMGLVNEKGEIDPRRALEAGIPGGLFGASLGAAGAFPRIAPLAPAVASAGQAAYEGERDPIHLTAAALAGTAAGAADSFFSRAGRAENEVAARRSLLGQPEPEPTVAGKRLWEAFLDEAGAVGGERGDLKPTKIPPVEGEAAGLHGKPPEADVVPAGKNRIPEIKTFQAPPPDEPKGVVGVPKHAGRNLGFSLRTRQNMDAPELRYANEHRGLVRIPLKDGRSILVGKPRNLDEMLTRIEENVPDEAERLEASRWYELIGPATDELAARGGVTSEQAQAGFGVGNQNMSPLGAMMTLVSRVEEMAGSPFPRMRHVADKNIDKALAGRFEDITFGEQTFKISDFTDGVRQKMTRSAMNNDPRGGEPIVIDVQAGRARGRMDDKWHRMLMDNATPEGRKKLRNWKQDAGGNPTPGQYERNGQEYREMVDELNKRAYLGRTDWNGKAIQALEWHSQTKASPHPIGGENPRGIVDHFTRTASIEFAMPEQALDASPVLRQLQDKYDTLALDPKLQTEAMGAILEDTARTAEDLVGLPRGAIQLASINPSYWAEPGQLAGQILIRGSRAQAHAAVDAMTFLRSQNAVPVFRPSERGDKLGFVVTSDALADPKMRQRVFIELKKEFDKAGIPMPDGFTPTLSGGKPAIASLFLSRGVRVKKKGRAVEYKNAAPVFQDPATIQKRKTLPERQAAEILARQQDPAFHAKLEKAISAVEDRLDIDLDGQHAHFEGALHDNPDPLEGSAPLSRLEGAAGAARRDLVHGALGGAQGRASDTLAAALDRRRVDAFGYAGFDSTDAFNNARLRPALIEVTPATKGVNELRQPIPARAFMMHHELLGSERRKGNDLLWEPNRSERRPGKQWLEAGFYDRSTGKAVPRERAIQVAREDFGDLVVAQLMGWRGDEIPTSGPDRRAFDLAIDAFEKQWLTSEHLKEGVRLARKRYMRKDVQDRAKARWEKARRPK